MLCDDGRSRLRRRPASECQQGITYTKWNKYLQSFILAIHAGHAFGVLVHKLALREDVSLSATRLYDV
jgi:hypothetical protein